MIRKQSFCIVFLISSLNYSQVIKISITNYTSFGVLKNNQSYIDLKDYKDLHKFERFKVNNFCPTIRNHKTHLKLNL